MKILSLGLDKSILNKNSSLAKRTVEYGNLVEKYTVIVPSREYKEIVLSEKANIVGVGAENKIITLFKIYKTAKKLLFEEKLVPDNYLGYDIITVQDQYYLALAGLLLAKKFLSVGRQGKLGFEIQVHGFEKYFGLRKRVAKFVLPRANAVRVVSQRLKRQLIDELGIKEERITAVPIFVEIGNVDKERLLRRGVYPAKSGTPRNDKFVFLTVGRLVPVKNIEIQIKALSNIIKQYPYVELWIVGEGEEKRNLKFEIGNLGLENNVKFFGWQDDLGKFYRQADVFLLTSNYEGWGMVIIEAASYGLPIIMTDVGCAGEVIKNGESGIVIPVGDQERLGKALIEIIKDENLRNKLGENAKQAALKLLSKEEILSLYLKSWQKAVS